MSMPPSGRATGADSKTDTAPMCMCAFASSSSRKLKSSAESRSAWVYGMAASRTAEEQLPCHDPGEQPRTSVLTPGNHDAK